MAKIVTSKAVNLGQLDIELGGQGLNMNAEDLTAVVITTADESTVTQSELEAGVAAHVAKAPAEPTVTEKLESIGLSVTDLKKALGL